MRASTGSTPGPGDPADAGPQAAGPGAAAETLPLAAGARRAASPADPARRRPAADRGAADLEVDGAEGPLAARLYVPHRAHWVPPGAARCSSSTAAAGCTATSRATTPPAGSSPSTPACRCWRSTTGSRPSTRSRPPWRTPGRVPLGGRPRGRASAPTRRGWRSAVTRPAATSPLSTAVWAAEEGLPLAFQLLIYPVADFVDRTESRRLFGEGFVLTETFMTAPRRPTSPPDADKGHPDAQCCARDDFPAGLAPAHVVTAGFDPLRDEGEALARAARGQRRRGGRQAVPLDDPRVRAHRRRRPRRAGVQPGDRRACSRRGAGLQLGRCRATVRASRGTAPRCAPRRSPARRRPRSRGRCRRRRRGAPTAGPGRAGAAGRRPVSTLPRPRPGRLRVDRDHVDLAVRRVLVAVHLGPVEAEQRRQARRRLVGGYGEEQARRVEPRLAGALAEVLAGHVPLLGVVGERAAR